METPIARVARHRRGSRFYLKRLVTAAGGVLVGIIILELSLWSIGAVISRDGFRADGIDEASGTRVFTILCVGDSWTEGKADGNFPDFLIEHLNSRGLPIRFRHVNLGRSGTNSSQTLRRLDHQIAEQPPDLVLVLTGNNDHHNLTDSTYWRFRDESLGWSSTLAARVRISMHSLRVYRLARAAWQKATGGPTANEFFAVESGETASRGGLIAIDSETHRRQLEYNLTKIVELARMARTPVVFQTYFHFHGYRVNEIIRNTAWDLDVPLADHNKAFHTRVTADRRETYRIEDGHPNPDGYRMIADWIVEVLEEHELIPRES